MKRAISIVCPALVLALAVSRLPAAGAEATPDSTSNVRVTFTLGKVEGKDKKTPLKSFALVVTSGGPSATLLTGARVPIPTTQATDAGTATTYTYQNVGLSAEVEAAIGAGSEVQMRATVENSWIDPSTKDTQPVVETRHQRISVLLKDGVALEIARSSDGEELRYVEVKADILKN
jgi:hypothetical protein